MKEKILEKMERVKYRKIGALFMTALFFMFVIIFASSCTVLDAIALEQQAECGIEQHEHTNECYEKDLLICGKEAHIHDMNCYLVLLNDNDINDLVTKIDDSDQHSLSGVVDSVITRAITFQNEEAQSAAVENTGSGNEGGNVDSSDISDVEYNRETILALNEAIREDEGNTSLTLNENINTFASSASDEIVDEVTSSGNVDEEIASETSDENIENEEVAAEDDSTETVADSTDHLLSNPVSGTATSSSNYANVYINLDGNWTVIGSVPFTISSNYRTVQNTEMLELLSEKLGLSYTMSDFDMGYASRNSTRYTKATENTSSIRFGRNNSTAAFNIRLYENNTNNTNNPLEFYTVTYEFPDGTKKYQYVTNGESVTLPTSYGWESGGTTYTGGQTVTITEATIFTAALPSGYLSIEYIVNFPQVSGFTFENTATVNGSSSYSEALNLNEFTGLYTVKNVSHNQVLGVGSTNNIVARFEGWQVGSTDTIIKPGQMTSEMLKTYVSGDSLTLTGKWTYSGQHAVNFYVRLDSVAVDTSGSIVGGATENYTPVLFTAFLAGDISENYSENTEYIIADVTQDNSYTADQEIRALYGEKETGVYMLTFPNDEDMFEALKQYALQYDNLEVDGVAVEPEDLHSDAYALRWYVFKPQSDSWHVDGKLVRKEGDIHVSKSFKGNETAIHSVKENYYISATKEDGTVTELNIENYDAYDSSTDTYVWHINQVHHGETWIFKEQNYNADGYAVYAEYILSDINGTSRVDHIEGEFEVTGQTYAPDEGKGEVLSLELTNYYIREDSLAIKKEDAATNRALPGAAFTLRQNGVDLSFVYSDGRYKKDDINGTITEIGGNEDGYIEFALEGISLDAGGELTFVETTIPSGYVGSGEVVIAKNEADEIYVKSGNAEFKDGVVIIKNSASTTSVTVEKKWIGDAASDRVVIQLLANGRLAGASVPGISHEVTLEASNDWKYTWEDLPSYVDGQSVTWSVREIQIGNEKCYDDFSFLNYLVFYGAAQQTTDASGKVKITLTVTNSSKDRVFLNVTKVSTRDGTLLAGADFQLELLMSDGTVDSSFTAINETTQIDGRILFDNLPYGTYRLTEINAPPGYDKLAESAILTIHSNNTVTLEEQNVYFEVDKSGALHLIVKNHPQLELAETGGSGILWLRIVGILIMLGAVFLYRKNLRGRCNG